MQNIIDTNSIPNKILGVNCCELAQNCEGGERSSNGKLGENDNWEKNQLSYTIVKIQHTRTLVITVGWPAFGSSQKAKPQHQGRVMKRCSRRGPYLYFVIAHVIVALGKLG